MTDAEARKRGEQTGLDTLVVLSLIHISEPTRQAENSYAVFCLQKKKATANYVPAAAVIGSVQALGGNTRSKVNAVGLLR